MYVVNLIFIIHLFLMYRSTALSIEERLLELEKVVKIQGTVIAKHEKIVEDQNVIIEKYENINIELTLRIESLESDMAKYKVNPMPSGATTYQQVHDNTQSRSDDLGEEEINSTTGQTDKPTDAAIDRLISKPNRSVMTKQIVLSTGQNSDVAFHAYITGTPCYNDHEVYVFNVEQLDLGNGYNTRDGIYVVPVSGYYVFTWTVSAYNGHWYRTDIIIDGTTSSWTTAQDETAATGIVVAQVSAGDHVFIRRNSGSYCGVDDQCTRSSFSGWKIF